MLDTQIFHVPANPLEVQRRLWPFLQGLGRQWRHDDPVGRWLLDCSSQMLDHGRNPCQWPFYVSPIKVYCKHISIRLFDRVVSSLIIP